MGEKRNRITNELDEESIYTQSLYTVSDGFWICLWIWNGSKILMRLVVVWG